MNKAEQFAEQQLTGFIHGKRGYDIESLLMSMGLEQEERESIKKEGGCMSALRQEEIEEIDKYFEERIITFIPDK